MHWPGAEMSSLAPSTVLTATLVILPISTLWPATVNSLLGDLEVLEDAFDRGQVEFGGHVHDGEIFVVELVVRVVIAGLAAGDALDLIVKGLGVAFAVHRDERGQLQQAGIDHAARRPGI